MELYRANPEHGAAWVTGASSGIGRQLALDLAREGYAVAATARSRDKLAALVAEAMALKGRVVAFPCDVTDEQAMRDTFEAIEAELGPVALAVFNAGNYFPARGYALETSNFTKSFQINVFGVIFGLVPLVERMRERGRGQVAFVGSATAYRGLPLASAYGATKAALNYMAESLKFDFDKMNIRIQMINPGFVETPLTKNNKFSMPALMTVAGASERIVAGLKTGGFEVSFPRRLTFGLKLMNLLPLPLYFWFVNWAMGRRKRTSGKRKRLKR
jgi:NAD(P)-dependent dehydrogenase (short-subunit alcohol dehydrogenase family)